MVGHKNLSLLLRLFGNPFVIVPYGISKGLCSFFGYVIYEVPKLHNNCLSRKLYSLKKCCGHTVHFYIFTRFNKWVPEGITLLMHVDIFM